MNGFEFVLTLVGMLVIGIWGTIIIAGKFGLYDNEKK